MRPVHRGVPDPGADDDQRVRTRRPDPRVADLHQGAAAGRADGGHGRVAALDLPRHGRGATTTGARSPRPRPAPYGRSRRHKGEKRGRRRSAADAVPAVDRRPEAGTAGTGARHDAHADDRHPPARPSSSGCSARSPCSARSAPSLMKKAVHSALCLAGTMIVLAVFYLAQGAYFLGVVQIVVYTGAIMMLFLFVVMLVGITAADSLKETIKGQRWLAAAVRARLRHPADRRHRQRLARHLRRRRRGQRRRRQRPGPGPAAVHQYVWAFEITGALLITAAIGAMVLTHRERTEQRRHPAGAGRGAGARRHAGHRRCPRPASTPGTTRWTSPRCCPTAPSPS